MTPIRDHDYLFGLVRELCKLPRETEWVEFKTNYGEPGAHQRAYLRSGQRRGP